LTAPFSFNHPSTTPSSPLSLHDALPISISGEAEPLTTALLARTFIALPFMTLFVTGRIHWHALRLWLKRVPWFRKPAPPLQETTDRKSTRLNSSHVAISYAVFCLKKKNK